MILNLSSNKPKTKARQKPLLKASKRTFVPRYPVTSLTPLRDQIRDNILLPTQYREYSHVNPSRSQNIKREIFTPSIVKEEETKSEVPRLPLQPRKLQLKTPQQRSPYMLRPRTYQEPEISKQRSPYMLRPRPSTYQDRLEDVVIL